MSVKVAIMNLEQAINQSVASKDFTRARQLIEVVETLSSLAPAKDELTPHEMSMLRTQGLVPVVKEVRARTNCGLKEAKDLVEAYIAKHGLRRVEVPGGFATYE